MAAYRDRVITAFHHPHIWTGDPRTPWTTRLVVRDGVVEHVGEGGPSADADVDLPGELVIPGLHDAHAHTGAVARALYQVDVNAATSLQEALVGVREYAAARPAGSWIRGGRWDCNRWSVPRQPTRHDLDAATGEHPAALESVDAHTVWANSAALRLAGVTRDTPDPDGGQIVRDEHGEPTGILRENAGALLTDALAAEPEDLAGQLRIAQAQMLALGLTSVTDIDGEDVRAAYQSLHDAGELHLRVAKAVRQGDLELALAEGRRTGDGDDLLSTGPLKLFSDGALGSHTCHMTHPIGPDSSNHGMAVLTVEQMTQLAERAVRGGLSVATHAIGDAAAAGVLDAYERLTANLALSDGLRLRIEHAQHLRPADVARMARLGVVASMQPTHCTSDYALVDALLAGHDLVSYGWATLLAAGVPLAFGSDAPVESVNPFFALHAAVTRQGYDGQPAGGWQPAERVSMEQAIAAHTLGAAYADGAAHRKGSLAVGKLADFVAVDTDLFSPEIRRDEPLRLRTALPVLTVVGGQVRYELGAAG